MIPALLSLAAVAAAVPVARQSGPTDVQILNYALTLEHLENAFYQMGVANFTSADFEAAGTSAAFYPNLQEIGKDEQTHVDFLSGALMDAAAKPCTYAFPVTDAASFLAVANILEGVGVSAYLGAAQYIMNKDYLTAAGSILTVEARHSAYLRDNNKASPFPSAFDIPLDLDEVYSLAAQFIVACPDSNPMLPVKAFPAITASPATPAKVGDVLSLTVVSAVDAKGAYFITTTGPVSAPVTGSGTTYSVTVPEGVQMGQEYLVLTSDMNKPTDDNIVAGPAIIMIADNVQTAPPTPSSPSYPPSSSAPAPAPSSYPPSGSAPPTSGGSPPTQEMPDGQPIQEMPDGQPIQEMPDGQPIQEMPDGQPIQEMPDGQPIQEMPDGQPIQQIGDGQVQNPVQQIGDGQVQVHPIQEMPDGQPTAPGY